MIGVIGEITREVVAVTSRSDLVGDCIEAERWIAADELPEIAVLLLELGSMG